MPGTCRHCGRGISRNERQWPAWVHDHKAIHCLEEDTGTTDLEAEPK